MVSGFPDVSNTNSSVSPFSKPFVSQSGWWCPALPMSPVHLFPPITYSNLFISQSGWWCPALPMSPIHVFPPINYSNLFVSQSGWRSPAFPMFSIHLFPHLAINSFVSQSRRLWFPPCLPPCFPPWFPLYLPLCLLYCVSLALYSTLFQSLEAGGGILTSHPVPMHVQGSGRVLEPWNLVS